MPLTSGLNHSMTSLENQANAVALDPLMEYKYMMQGFAHAHGVKLVIQTIRSLT